MVVLVVCVCRGGGRKGGGRYQGSLQSCTCFIPGSHCLRFIVKNIAGKPGAAGD